MKKILLLLLLFCATLCNAQIGYQVSLLNTATGEPRAFEKVKCEIEIKDSEGKAIHKETQKATSNDFGVISLSIGDEHTFDAMDWSKLPLFISVSIDGKLIGESQILTVPVAEYAKKTGALTYENIGSKSIVGCHKHKWTIIGNSISVLENGYPSGKGKISIDGNSIVGYIEDDDEIYTVIGHYSPEDDKIYIILSMDDL